MDADGTRSKSVARSLKKLGTKASHKLVILLFDLHAYSNYHTNSNNSVFKYNYYCKC